MYEPIHGSAFDITGKGIANPIGQIWSGALMLEHLGHPDAAAAVMRAIERMLADGPRTPDLGGKAKCSEVAAAVIQKIGSRIRAHAARVRPAVAILQTLVILRRRERQHVEALSAFVGGEGARGFALADEHVKDFPRDAVLVKVSTDEGLTGWGEAHHGRCPGAIAKLIDTTISELVVGMDAMNVVGVWQHVAHPARALRRRSHAHRSRKSH